MEGTYREVEEFVQRWGYSFREETFEGIQIFHHKSGKRLALIRNENGTWSHMNLPDEAKVVNLKEYRRSEIVKWVLKNSKPF